MRDGNENEEIEALRLLIKQLKNTNRSVIKELQKINKRLSSKDNSTTDVPRTHVKKIERKGYVGLSYTYLIV